MGTYLAILDGMAISIGRNGHLFIYIKKGWPVMRNGLHHGHLPTYLEGDGRYYIYVGGDGHLFNYIEQG